MEINKYIDHTLLKAEATTDKIKKLCEEAIEYNFKTVCINPSWVKLAHSLLKDSTVGITTVVGFPLGANATMAKVYEAKLAIEHGADEIDMVINIGRLKDGQDEYVLNEIRKIKEAIKGHVLKVIIENALLTKSEKITACEIVTKAGADFVKTSTGFSYNGATVEDVKLMRASSGEEVSIKAAGGVRNLADAEKMISAGATRIGTSAGIAIVTGKTAKTSY